MLVIVINKTGDLLVMLQLPLVMVMVPLAMLVVMVQLKLHSQDLCGVSFHLDLP